jgi:transcriptional regulator of acetoin/glycerol metabolism
MPQFYQAVEVFKRAYWNELLDACGGCVTEASRRSGVHRQHIYKILRRLGVKHPCISTGARRGVWYGL